jgi:hypothetical protein
MNRYGAIIAMQHKLTGVQRITIRRTGDERRITAQVLGQLSEKWEEYVYGLSFLEPISKHWDTGFSSVDETQEAVSRHMLECDICHTRSTVYLDSIQMEVFQTIGSILLPCKQCAEWTKWGLAEYEAATDRSLREIRTNEPPRPQPDLGPRTSNERRRFRVRLKKFRVCIRRPGYLDEIVSVENVSCDGFRFVSSKNYPEGTNIEVALPYMPDTANIFVSARVTRSRALPRRKKAEYGVAFIKTQKELP